MNSNVLCISIPVMIRFTINNAHPDLVNMAERIDMENLR